VRQAVSNLTVFDGLDQVGGSCLPLGTAGACVCARHFPLGNSHGYLISLLVQHLLISLPVSLSQIS
jgi:hypothetical protein